MIKLNNNGYIIQRKKNTQYKGVDGDNWYLNYSGDDPFFEAFYNENIDKAWDNLDYVDCCSDESYIQKYIQESQKMGIEFRVLLCATCKKFPITTKQNLVKKKVLLGYDFAYSGGSYYSSILNDILSGRIAELKKIRLNQNGLFNTYKEAEQFIQSRNNLSNKYYFEQGDFIIYQITEVFI